jgi:hypothetical protein
VIDPKAELANITAERRAALGQEGDCARIPSTVPRALARYRKHNPLSVLTLDNRPSSRMPA